MSDMIVSEHDDHHGSVLSYTVGFILSIGLTLNAYRLVTHGSLHGWKLIYGLGGLAVAQLIVQLVCFLHVGRESRPRWNLSMLLFAVMVVFILVFGSLWIMHNLQYGHEHTPSQQDIIKDEGYQP